MSRGATALAGVGFALAVAGWLAVAPRPTLPRIERAPGDTSFDIDTSPPPQSPVSPLRIVEWPIPYDDERKRLTVDYLRFHAGEDGLTGDLDADTTMTPRMIVLHWTGGPTAKSAWWQFERIRTSERDLDPERAVNLSAHFVVERDGTIYRLLPEDRVARHTIGLNHLAIGIENVGGLDRYPLTEAQVEADAALVRDLAARFPITHLIGHYEYRQMEGHPYFKERDPFFRTVKADPGPEFMLRVRERVADLGLEGPPQ
jgi:N-acetylmuramoyl-L-alanine amidase